MARSSTFILTDDGLDRVRQVVEAFFRESSIFLAYAYGSRVSGRPLPDSDLDIGYYTERGPAARRLTLRDELSIEAGLSAALQCEVDLRNLADAPLEFRGRVLEEGRRIYCSDEEARVNLERDLLGRYHDYKAEFGEMRDLRLRQLANRR